MFGAPLRREWQTVAARSVATGRQREVERMAAPSIPAPERRLLRAFAYDPLLADVNNTVVTLSVPREPLNPGPSGALVKVIDFDPVRRCWYEPVDLENPDLLAQAGLPPSEADPRFHQQMIYGITSSVLEHFEQALGRRFRFGRKPLVMYPHALREQNAYYDPGRRGILFGYFRADRDHPGRMMPGQLVFTCLSHDIIAHELTHAVVDRLRPEFLYPTNHDVAAFHEAFADLVALFHHFTLPDLVRRHIQSAHADITDAAPLVDLATQFGEATGMGQALRSGIDMPDPGRLARTLECHDRGAILVGAVFAAFLETYKSRIADLLRIATSGTGILPEGHLHPDLVARVAGEATANASRFMNICVRAFDYLPGVDVTFGDFLRALVTADRALFPRDEWRLRATIVEEFRRRGIYPDQVASLAEGSLRWPDADFDDVMFPQVSQLVRWTAEDFDLSTRATNVVDSLSHRFIEQREAERRRLARQLTEALKNMVNHLPHTFGFHPDRRHPIAIRGFHASFRASEDGQPRVDVVIQARQERPDLAARPEFKGTGLRFFAATTIVTDSIGRIRHVITKPLPVDADRPGGDEERDRVARSADFVADRDAIDPTQPWTTRPNRIAADLSFQNLHLARVGGQR
jgi:hypothetical protein